MSVIQQLKNTARALLTSSSRWQASSVDALLQIELSRELARLQAAVRASMPENPAVHGFKIYSQADEDGILEEITHRLGIDRGHFIEIGCGDGCENNSHYLLLKQWKGVWVDGDPKNIAAIRASLPASGRLRVVQEMVTRDNVTALATHTDKFGPLDVFSIDVDGNDLAIAEAAIEAWSPKIVVGEYNAKFPYPLQQEVRYDDAHRWAGDDYHGASLAAWVDRLRLKYQLVTCNLAGTNAFFVRQDLAERFATYAPAQLYQPARFHLTALRCGHAPSLKFLRDSLRSEVSV